MMSIQPIKAENWLRKEVPEEAEDEGLDPTGVVADVAVDLTLGVVETVIDLLVDD
jgi:hypothetical protein